MLFASANNGASGFNDQLSTTSAGPLTSQLPHQQHSQSNLTPASQRRNNMTGKSNIATKGNNPGGTIGGECYDYRCGVCINGPHCKYRHVRRPPEDIETLRLPQWYFKKIKSVFT